MKIEGVQRAAGYPPNNNVLATGSTTVAGAGWYSFVLSPAISLLAGAHFDIVIALIHPTTLYSTGERPGGQSWLWNGSGWQSPRQLRFQVQDVDDRAHADSGSDPGSDPSSDCSSDCSAHADSHIGRTENNPHAHRHGIEQLKVWSLQLSESATAALISEGSGAPGASPASGVQGDMTTANTPSASPRLGLELQAALAIRHCRSLRRSS